MRKKAGYMLLVLLVLAACKKANKEGSLFRIFQNGKYGYINSKADCHLKNIFPFSIPYPRHIFLISYCQLKTRVYVNKRSTG